MNKRQVPVGTLWRSVCREKGEKWTHEFLHETVDVKLDSIMTKNSLKYGQVQKSMVRKVFYGCPLPGGFGSSAGLECANKCDKNDFDPDCKGVYSQCFNPACVQAAGKKKIIRLLECLRIAEPIEIVFCDEYAHQQKISFSDVVAEYVREQDESVYDLLQNQQEFPTSMTDNDLVFQRIEELIQAAVEERFSKICDRLEVIASRIERVTSEHPPRADCMDVSQ